MRRYCTLLLVLSAMTFSPAGSQEKRRIAVLDFDFSAIQPWWGGYNWDVGAGVSDIVIKNLVRSGNYRVIERRALEAILAEQDLSNSDRANLGSAAQIGRLLGVDAIVVGSITQFGTEKKKKSFGGIGGGWGGLAGAKIGTTEGKAVVAIDARVVDVETGEIVAVAEGAAESSRSGLLLGGIGVGGGGFGAGGVDMSSSEFRETILGEATHLAAEELSDDLVDARYRIPERVRVIRGLVAYAESGLVILNVGETHGVTVGMELSVERVKQTVKDPATGRILREITSPVARIRVTQVEGGSSEATVVSGSAIQVGDVVRND